MYRLAQGIRTSRHGYLFPLSEWSLCPLHYWDEKYFLLILWRSLDFLNHECLIKNTSDITEFGIPQTCMQIETYKNQILPDIFFLFCHICCFWAGRQFLSISLNGCWPFASLTKNRLSNLEGLDCYGKWFAVRYTH